MNISFKGITDDKIVYQNINLTDIDEDTKRLNSMLKLTPNDILSHASR